MPPTKPSRPASTRMLLDLLTPNVVKALEHLAQVEADTNGGNPERLKSAVIRKLILAQYNTVTNRVR